MMKQTEIYFQFETYAFSIAVFLYRFIELDGASTIA